jgi:hypothetical protein
MQTYPEQHSAELLHVVGLVHGTHVPMPPFWLPVHLKPGQQSLELSHKLGFAQQPPPGTGTVPCGHSHSQVIALKT